jgi:hypothetical protein
MYVIVYFRPLVDIINSLKKEDVKLKAAKAIEALSDKNERSQQAFIDLGAQKALLKILKVNTEYY